MYTLKGESLMLIISNENTLQMQICKFANVGVPITELETLLCSLFDWSQYFFSNSWFLEPNFKSMFILIWAAKFSLAVDDDELRPMSKLICSHSLITLLSQKLLAIYLSQLKTCWTDGWMDGHVNDGRTTHLQVDGNLSKARI